MDPIPEQALALHRCQLVDADEADFSAGMSQRDRPPVRLRLPLEDPERERPDEVEPAVEEVLSGIQDVEVEEAQLAKAVRVEPVRARGVLPGDGMRHE